MRYYPAFLDLHDKKCLLVGLGGVGRRKLATLLECSPARVLVLDPFLEAPAPELSAMLERPEVQFEKRAFQESDLDDVFLVIAASGDADLNQELAALCKTRGILINVIDQPQRSSFTVPSSLEVGGMTVALSTGGQSPALARKLRRDLQDYLGVRYTAFLTMMGRLRPRVLELGLPTEENTALFRALVNSDLPDAFAQQDAEAVHNILSAALPEALVEQLDEVLNELV